MKLSHLLLAGLIALPASYVSAENNGTTNTKTATEQQEQIFAELKAALAQARTPEDQAAVIAAAVAKDPCSAANIQAAAEQAGVSTATASGAVTVSLASIEDIESKDCEVVQKLRQESKTTNKNTSQYPTGGHNGGGGGVDTASGG